MSQPLTIEHISAVTLTTREMGRAVRFYQLLGFAVEYGGAGSDFTTLVAGSSALNLRLRPPPASESVFNWGRVIFHVSDVDAYYEAVLAQGLKPEFSPRDAPWGERYFHIRDSDGHRLSFAKPLS